MEGRKLGKYEIRGVVGRGAAGVVHEAWDPVMARVVAIKLLPLIDLDDEGKEKYARFMREAQAAARLHHPNVVTAFDYGETDSSAYIVMEFLAGPSLKARLGEHSGPLALTDIAPIMRGLLAGLQHSHQRGVVHRDIKPGNVVFSADGEVKLTDFGIAHLESSGMTRDGAVLGTPAYMAPEQVTGDPVDARTDIYAAGGVLYEMLTGRRPFEGSTASVMHKIVTTMPLRPSELAPTVSVGMDMIVATAMAKAPADRYQSVAEFATALEAEFRRAAANPPVSRDAPATVAGQQSMSATGDDVSDPTNLWPSPETADALRTQPASPPTPGAPPSRMRTRLLVGLGGGILAAVALAAVWTGSATRQRSAPDTTMPQAALPLPAAMTTLPPSPAPAAGAPVVPTPKPATETAAPAPTPATPTSPAPSPVTTASSAPVVPPATVGQVDDGMAPLRRQVSSIAASAPCAFMTTTVAADGSVRLTGVSALSEASGQEVRATLERAIHLAAPAAPVLWDITRLSGAFCDALDLFRPLSGPSSGATVGLSLAVNGRSTSIAPRVAADTPGRTMVLAVDVFDGSGTVEHIYSGAAAAPGTKGAEDWTVDNTGQDRLVTTIAASASLFTAPRPRQEQASTYLNDLAARLEQAQARGDTLAADAKALLRR